MSDTPHFYNRTRRSQSIPLTLLKRGRLLEVPLYFTLRQSDLAREGLERSGSWAFADHIYRGVPSGRGWFGRWLDARLLAMPSARSFRNRYLAASEEVARFLRARDDRPLHVLSVPCGIPRELGRGARLWRAEAAVEGRSNGTDVLQGVTFHGLDLDDVALRSAMAFADEYKLPFVAHHGDAFDRSSYPEVVDFITCTGFGEFLDGAHLEQLYRLFHEVLRPGGWLVTTGMRRHWAADYLLRLAELHTHYRTGADLETIARLVSFRQIDIRTDDVGLQSILIARK